MTHLANADDLADPYTREQLASFGPLAKRLGAAVSISNSAGVLGWPEAHGDWVRPGLMLYGASAPFAGGRAASHGLRPVIPCAAVSSRVNRYRQGDRIGYGAPMSAEADAGGRGRRRLRRRLPPPRRSGTPVADRGARAALVGRVSMDMISVDLRGLPRCQGSGDPVVLWGEGLPIEEIAEWADTIPYS